MKALSIWDFWGLLFRRKSSLEILTSETSRALSTFVYHRNLSTCRVEGYLDGGVDKASVYFFRPGQLTTVQKLGLSMLESGLDPATFKEREFRHD